MKTGIYCLSALAVCLFSSTVLIPGSKLKENSIHITNSFQSRGNRERELGKKSDGSESFCSESLYCVTSDCVSLVKEMTLCPAITEKCISFTGRQCKSHHIKEESTTLLIIFQKRGNNTFPHTSYVISKFLISYGYIFFFTKKLFKEP